ncbi:NXPE family member 3-like [Gadus chalcogrammus]|uniref:NXPE family member 3-like n=1 Tax=Gadus chalcogrammus TaxID=1042646 RepID=UPI0024C4C579|nr:NXPE family member 3-like [Gadus chalcogrammus]XP_056459057.1 NXPE family member 3-like [Gadus chalcogrammus]
MVTVEYDAVSYHALPKGLINSRHRFKYVLVFFFLAVSVFIFLLRDIVTLEGLSCHTAWLFFPPRNSSCAAYTQKTPQSSQHPVPTFCSHRGPGPTPDEALEDRRLLDAIAWPQPPAGPVPAPLNQTSDPAHSQFAILVSRGLRAWRVGDQLEALVQMKDFQGRSKLHGGDFLVARLHSPALGAGVAGRVVDHLDGSYSALFPLPWAGPATATVTMVHSSEAVAVLRRLRERWPNRIFFHSLYRVGNLSETTACLPCLPPDYPQRPLCNHTDPHTGEPWYCYKPERLGCDARVNHAMGGYQKPLYSKQEALLFRSGVNLKVVLHASGPDSIDVLPQKIDGQKLENSSTSAELVKYTPAGYYYQSYWKPVGGTPARRFDTSSSITQCLTGKVINMYGDSTMRQWFEYLSAFIPEFNLHRSKMVGPLMAVDSKHNILMKYRCHGPPIRIRPVVVSELRYVANELDGLAGGPDTVVLFSVWAHFTSFPVEVYIRRMRHIRRATVRLLARGPGTLVVIRSANFVAMDQTTSTHSSDWFSLQMDGVLRAMFQGLAVVLVDAWEMTLAHHSAHNIHPPPPIIKNMVDLVLAHVCPDETDKKS